MEHKSPWINGPKIKLSFNDTPFEDLAEQSKTTAELGCSRAFLEDAMMR